MGIQIRTHLTENADAIRYNLVDARITGFKKNGDPKFKKVKVAMGSVDFDPDNIDSLIDFAKSLETGEHGEDKVFNERVDTVTESGAGKIVVVERSKGSVLASFLAIKEEMAVEQTPKPTGNTQETSKKKSKKDRETIIENAANNVPA